ncbi:MAG: hypothetical protein HKP13_05720 [Gammaproteobacteria bacterium]|nr:hypothetical protein [Gammaproteobacteria bacterium]
MNVTPRRFLALVEGLISPDSGVRPRLVGLEITMEHLQTPEEVNAAIRAFAPRQGWLQFQSNVCCYDPDHPASISGKYGTTLAGELAHGNESSLHIVRDGSDGWRLTTYREDSAGENYLVEDEYHLAELEEKSHSEPETDCAKRCGEKLHYRVYWILDEAHGCAPRIARFAGFHNSTK